MEPIKSVAVLGAGALGAFYANKFHKTGDFNVMFVACGDRTVPLKQGVIVNGERLILPVGPSQNATTVDLILVALKHHQLAEALPILAPLVGPKTLFLSVLNGLDSEAMIAEVYGVDKVLYCIAVGIDAVRHQNTVEVANPGQLIFGDTLNRPPSHKVIRVQQALDRASLQWQTPEDMMRSLWWKFMVNVGVNQSSAILKAPYRVFQTSEPARKIMRTLMLEVIQVGRAEGINLNNHDLDEWEKVLSRLAPEAKTSMLQDIESGRKTEVEIFAGKVIALGQKHQIPTPANSLVQQMLQVLEGII